jgi:hypothetical protein
MSSMPSRKSGMAEMIMDTKSEAPPGPWLSRNSWTRSCRMKEGSSSSAERSPMERSLIASTALPTAVTASLIMTTACPIATGAGTWKPISLARRRPILAQWV